ncbi:MAG: hypothetical protein K8S98_17330 [Planctomycetes bacterium]|nr:hypothetical protein [Planctomycetota bacterium]
MNVWLSLWRKEARDQRMLLLVSAALFVTLLLGARLVVGASFDGPLRTGYVHPIAWFVVAAALAAEALTRDAESGVERSLTRLAMARSTLWATKASFVLGALLAFGGFQMLCERTLVAWDPANGARPAVALSTWCALGALVVASVLAAATLVRRALAAALLGVGAPVALAWLVHAAPDGVVRDWILRGVAVASPGGTAFALAFALAVGSLAGYAVACVEPFGLRRAAALSLGFAIALAGPFTWTVARAANAIDPRPSVHNLTSWRALPSPDGRFVALDVQCTRDFLLEWGTWLAGDENGDPQVVRNEVWILDRATGAIDELDERWRLAWAPYDAGGNAVAWTADGRLATVASERFFGDGERRGELLDPATGAVVGRFDVDEDEPVSEVGTPPWQRVTLRDGACELGFADGSCTTTLDADARLVVSPERGVYFVERNGAILRAELGAAETTRLGERRGERSMRTRVSPDGRWLAWRDEAGLSIVDARTGAKLFGPAPEHFVEWSTHGRVATLSGSNGGFVIELDGSRRALEGSWPRECGPDGWLTRMPDRLTWRSDDGTRVEELPMPSR